MRIIIYAETQKSTIGGFDEPDVRTCALVVGSKEDLGLISQALALCTRILNPLGYMQNLCGQLKGTEIGESARERVGGAEVIVRICKEDLLALVPEDVMNPEERLFIDIRQMALTANELMEVAPEISFCDEMYREDPLSVLTSLAAALEVIMTDGIPLRDRFDIFDLEDYYGIHEYDKVIRFINGKEWNKISV